MVTHQVKRCGRTHCRKTYWYNYSYEDGDKVNCLSLQEAEYIFVSNTAGFDKNYLIDREHLHFRAHISAAAVVYTIIQTCAA